MGLLADGKATASLLPPEAFDKGWRKVVIIVVLNALAAASMYLAYLSNNNIAWTAAAALCAGAVAADLKYLGINKAEYEKSRQLVEKALPYVEKVIAAQQTKEGEK